MNEAQAIREKVAGYINNLPKKHKEYLIGIGNELKPIIENIEKSIPTTQHHYGEYMRVLSYDICKNREQVIGAVLIYSGANPLGVSAAVRNIK